MYALQAFSIYAKAIHMIFWINYGGSWHEGWPLVIASVPCLCHQDLGNRIAKTWAEGLDWNVHENMRHETG